MGKDSSKTSDKPKDSPNREGYMQIICTCPACGERFWRIWEKSKPQPRKKPNIFYRFASQVVNFMGITFIVFLILLFCYYAIGGFVGQEGLIQ